MSTLAIQENVECLAWYVQTQLITAGRRNFQTQHQKNPLALTILFRRLEKFYNTRNVESRTGLWRPTVFKESCKHFVPTPASIKQGP